MGFGEWAVVLVDQADRIQPAILILKLVKSVTFVNGHRKPRHFGILYDLR
jgi:hypothetical protein